MSTHHLPPPPNIAALHLLLHQTTQLPPTKLSPSFTLYVIDNPPLKHGRF